jgi:hypothetical protein
MSMTVYEGEVSLVGAGTWTDGAAQGNGTGGQGKTILSVLEIGGQSLRKIILPDYISNYLQQGKQSTLLIGSGLSQGLITRPFIAAVKVDGKTYKESDGMLIFMLATKTILYAILFGVILGAFFAPLGLVAAGAVFYYHFKDYAAFKSF